jgi:hypothetical protein
MLVQNLCKAKSGLELKRKFSFSQNISFLRKSLMVFYKKREKIVVTVTLSIIYPPRKELQKWLNCHFATELYTSWQVTFYGYGIKQNNEFT